MFGRSYSFNLFCSLKILCFGFVSLHFNRLWIFLRHYTPAILITFAITSNHHHVESVTSHGVSLMQLSVQGGEDAQDALSL